MILEGVCDDLSTLFETMGGITGAPNIKPTTSVEDVESFASDVVAAHEDVVASAQDLLIYLGIVLTVNAAWALLGLPILVAYLHLGVIRREEEYLEDCFEGEYLAYKAKVPRWIPRLVTETN